MFTITAAPPTTPSPAPGDGPSDPDGPDDLVRDINGQSGQTLLEVPDTTGLIAGVVVGGLMLIALVIIATLLVIRYVTNDNINIFFA